MVSVTPWSYSSITAFATCPHRFFLTRISKQVREGQTEAMTHGNEVHKALEEYVGGAKDLPEKYEAHRPVADKIKDAPGKKLLEYKFGLTKGLKPTTFFAKDVWVRGVFDVAITRPNEAVVLDWKTGARKMDSDQLRLFAGAAMCLWPFAETIKTGYIWLKTGEMDTQTFTPNDKPDIFQDFAARVHRMEASAANNDWPARPSGLCRNWCPVGKQLCVHCGS